MSNLKAQVRILSRELEGWSQQSTTHSARVSPVRQHGQHRSTCAHDTHHCTDTCTAVASSVSMFWSRSASAGILGKSRALRWWGD